MRLEIVSCLAWIIVTTGCRTTGSDSATLGLEGCDGAIVAPEYVAAHVALDLSSELQGDQATIQSRVATKTPVLIYMAVDTDEPFMKLAVDHEVRSLRTACESHDTKVNWIAFVNSLFVTETNGAATPIILRCEAGVLKTESLPAALNAKIEKERNLYASGKSCTDDQSFCLRINQPFLKDKGAEFRRFPLAHPEIVLDLLEYTRSLYPANAFAYVLHIKSHGSENFLTTGLGPEQVKEKSECQAKVIKKYYDDHPEQFVPASSNESAGTLGQVGLGQVGLGQVGLGQVGLGQVGLGQVGLGQVGLGQVGLGQVGLGQVGLGQVGLGNIGGLGLGVAGLGATNHYGSRHVSMLTALQWFTTHGTGDEDVPFIFFESCESRASRILANQATNCALPPSANPLTNAFNNVQGVYAYYSAAQSLWYRNLDWDLVYATWLDGPKTTARFQAELVRLSKLIPNYNFTAQDPLPPCP